MSSYQLFDQSISFPDSAERFFDMQYHAWNAISAASNDFDAWYEKCGNILTVLKGYKEKACELIIQYANRPLFNELASYEIYDLSEDSYDKKCLAFSKSLEALAVIREKYEDILAEQAAEEEYRAERKENRGRVVGGGFGVGGALKGMAAAGAMNAISGVGHDIVNVIGNASSALVAASSKSALYNSADTRTMMREGIKADILNCFNAHMELLNNRITSHIVSVFDADKAEALFENAKKVADKQKHLLIESFKNCPWNEELFEFVFIHYKTERKNIWNISKRFHIDLSKTAEETFAASYTEKARTSEEESQIVKKDILAQMRELGISSSATIKAIELDGLNRILRDYDSVADENRGPIFEAFDNYDADRSNKSEAVYKNGVWELAQKYDVKFSSEEADAILAKYYIESAQNVEAEALKARVKMTAIMEILGISQSFTLDKLENDCLERICNNYQNADEQMCNRIIKYIREFEALQKNKEPFLQKVQAQIEKIWAKEDGEIFDNVYLNTNIYSQEEIKKAIEFIKAKGRTADAEKYITALTNCTAENIARAKKFQSQTMKWIMYAGIILIILTVVFIFNGNVVLSVIMSGIGAAMLAYYGILRANYNVLTLDGTIRHKMIIVEDSVSTTGQGASSAYVEKSEEKKTDQE